MEEREFKNLPANYEICSDSNWKVYLHPIIPESVQGVRVGTVDLQMHLETRYVLET